MTDEATSELLSRLLDDDLDDADRVRLEARLVADPGLRAELEALESVRAATRSIADRMEPPAALDALLEPLRSGTPHGPRATRPVVRWLGMAAGVALAVTVAMEVARRSPPSGQLGEPTPPARTVPLGKPEMYQLKPLPTSPVPPEEELLGVAERLLASPPAEPELDELEPLDVRGPLPMADNEQSRAGRDDSVALENEGTTTPPAASQPAGLARSTRRAAAAPAAVEAHVADAKAGRPVVATRCVLLDGAGVVVGEIDVAGAWPEGPTEVAVTVAGGAIVAVATAASDKDASALSEDPWSAFLGVAAPGIPDGRYLARPAMDHAPPSQPSPR